jgi:riboflavin kinase/FMN adenylyltransferase
MKLVTTLRALGRIRKPVVLAAGFFDGVHLGHRRVLDRALAEARRRDAEAWALTFDEHPLRVLQPGAAPPILTAAPHKVRLLAEAGLDGAVLLRFTRRLAATPASEFVRGLLEAAPGLAAIVVGRNWTFGRGGEGTAALLRRLVRPRGLAVRVVAPLRRGGAAISSTRIRRLVALGRLEAAERLLGRPFSIQGTVVPGRRFGRTLGVPTANIDPHHEARPPHGVYAVLAAVRGRLHRAVANLGVRPTLVGAAGNEPALEVHLLDTSPELYGEELEVFFVARLRDERRFRSFRALKAQIRRDILRARRLLRAFPDTLGGTKKSRKRTLYKRRRFR